MEQHINDENEHHSTFDIKLFFSKLLKNYLWFIASVLLFTSGAYLYLKYTSSLYQVVAFVEVQPPDEAASILGGSPFSSSGNTSSRNYPDMNGEIFKLQSAALVGGVVDSLQLDLRVTTKEGIKTKVADIEALPFTVITKRKNINRASGLYKLTLGEDGYRLKNDQLDTGAQYDQPLVVDEDTLIIGVKNRAAIRGDHTWGLALTGRQNAVLQYTGRLVVAPVPKGGAGMLQVVMRDEIPERARRIIEVLIYQYDVSNFVYKNKALRSEIAFLNKRLDTVNAELETQENYVRSFKANNKINDVSSSATEVLSSLSGIDTRKSDNDYKARLLNLVESNVSSGGSREERINVPGLQDADLIGLVAKYNDLVFQKSDILDKGTPMDLRLPPINTKLGETKANVLKRVAAIRQELSTNNGFLQSQERSMTNRFVSLPGKEKDYIQVNRLLNIKQSLYVFLLQKMEDKNIEFASSNILGTRIVDWRVNNIQDPKPMMVYLVALLTGLLIPAVVILIKFISNKRIESSAQVTKATSLPIAGEIAYISKLKDEIVITAGNVTPVAEQFRTLRTNISYLSHGQPNKVLVITSGISGEGKSFISLNLANALAISDNRVVLLEFDLRNPGLSDKLLPPVSLGITDYLSAQATLDQIIQPVQGCDQLYFISAGSFLPANPGEIIHNHKMQELFDHLRQHFDYIILDTPPIEAVADALILGKWADASFFVVRHRYTLFSSLVRLNQLHEDKKIPRPALVINGIRAGSGFSSLHGYGYGYGYGYTQNGKVKKTKRPNGLKIA